MVEEATGRREYRMAELAAEAGISVRTLRFYRERKLLPPPRREGRIAWYSEAHLARLRTIGALLERGHALGGIAELIAAWESGRNVGELLGLENAIALPWSKESPVRLSPEELADRFGSQATAENLAAALEIGYVAIDGEQLVHVSRRLLDASAALVREGVPMSEVLSAGRRVREHADALADLFTVLIRRYLPDPDAAALERLRPLAATVVDAEVCMAMDRRVRAELDSWLHEHAPGDRSPGHGAAGNQGPGDRGPANRGTGGATGKGRRAARGVRRGGTRPR